MIGTRILFFIDPPLKMQFSVPAERVETSKVGLKVAVSIRSTGTQNRIFEEGAMK